MTASGALKRNRSGVARAMPFSVSSPSDPAGYPPNASIPQKNVKTFPASSARPARIHGQLRGQRVLFILALAYLTACASSGPVEVTPPAPAAESPYIVHPLSGYPLTVGSELESQTNAAFAVLRSASAQDLEQGAGTAAAAALLEEDPGFHPARVLEAQNAFLLGRYREVADALAPVADELPDYIACQLVLGAAYEQLGDLRRALASFTGIAGRDALAETRRQEIQPRVIDALFKQLEDAMDRRRPDLAEEALAALEPLLEPENSEWLDAQLLVAVTQEDRHRELELLRQLVVREPADDLLERLGDLELEIGEIRRGLEIFEDLALRPDAPLIFEEKAQRARFLWRLEQLPEHVQEIRLKGEIDRADLADLLYWLVPSVRYAKVTNPPIATDILDHPRRKEIVRVLNLGFLDVDTALHRFSPEEPASRSASLSALLALMLWDRSEYSCLQDVDTRDLTGGDLLVCAKAAQCGLIPEPADCLPRAGLSGSEAIELFRRALDLLAPAG